MTIDHEDRSDEEPSSRLPHATTDVLRAEVASKDREDSDVEAEVTYEPAKLSVRVDHELLNSLVVEVPVPDESRGRYDAEEIAEKAEAKRAELEVLLDKVRRLPETLDFQPGTTLIVGENGGGKSTLAKAFHLAMQFDKKYRDHIEPDEFYDEEERRTPEEARQWAFNRTFLDKTGSQGEDLAMAGLGAQLGPAFIDGIECVSNKSATYVDVGQVYGRAAGNMRRNALERNEAATDWSTGQARTRTITVAGEGTLNAKSTRQSIDEYLGDFKEMRTTFYDPGKPFMSPAEKKEAMRQPRTERGSINFVDEPETGLSPRRHIALAEEIEDIFGGAAQGNIVIAPTNSVVLFQSDLPRIDLEYPERGIHRPSDYPDHDTIPD